MKAEILTTTAITRKGRNSGRESLNSQPKRNANDDHAANMMASTSAMRRYRFRILCRTRNYTANVLSAARRLPAAG